MQRQALLLTFALSTLLPLAVPTSAQAQWPEHSVLAVLPPPVAMPSDALAAFLFRMEVMLDQPRPSDPIAYGDYLRALLERMRQTTEHPPHAENPAEQVVIDGVFALISETIALRGEREMTDVSEAARPVLNGLIDEMRSDARDTWARIAAITDPSPEARAWVTYARERIAVLERALARPRTARAETRRIASPEERPVEVRAIARPSSDAVAAIVAEARRVATDGPTGAGHHPGSMRR